MMPLYDFKCIVCDCVLERRQKHEEPNPDCEECGNPTERLITNTSFVLKGEGWYKDGYSKKTPKS